MKKLYRSLLIAGAIAGALAFGSFAMAIPGGPPIAQLIIQLAGVAQPVNTVNFSTGINGVKTGGTLALTVPAGVPLTRTLTTTAPVTCNGGGSCDLSVDRTLALAAGGVGPTQLANTAVSANSYGDASHVPNYTVDAQGRLTAAASTAIAIAESAVASLTTDLAAKAPIANASMTGTFTTAGFDVNSSNAGNVTIAANESIFAPAGTTGVNLANATGNFNFPTGNVAYSGASGKSVAITTAGASGTITIQGAGNTADVVIRDGAQNSVITLDENTVGARIAYQSNTLTCNGTACSIAGGVPTLPGVRIAALLVSATAPTISSGFGTGASVTANNGTAAFRIGVGTTSASTGVIGLPTATTGWNCFCNDITTNSTTITYCKQTASSTASATIGNFTDIAGAAAWADNNVLAVSCFAY